MRNKTITAGKVISLFLLGSMLFTTETIEAQEKDALNPEEAKAKQAYSIGEE